MDTKRCPHCGLTKPVSEFYANKGRLDGLSPYCVDCARAATRTSLIALKQRAVDHLGGVCGRCGFADVRALQVDHVNGGGSARRRAGEYSGQALYRRVLKADPGEYQLLCANCNWIKRYEEEEWVGGREYVRQTVTTRRRLTDEEREARKAAANVKRSGTQRAPTLARDNEIVCSFISGWSKAEIAREHEMTPAAVHAVLKRYGPKCSACGSVRVRNIPVMVDGKLEGEMDDDRHVLMRCKACGHKWPALCPIHDV